MERYLYIIILLIFLPILPVGAQSSGKMSLPHRDALASEIKFWKQVFAKVSLDEYLIHDSQDLSIIYQTVAFNSSVSERKREKELRDIKDKIKQVLLKLHSGELELPELTVEEREIYQLFNHIDEDNKFLNASRRIRAQQGIRENFVAGVRRSFAYLPHIKEVFNKEGLPPALVYLPHVESSFNPVAVSHVGAAGMWQFMRGTARGLMKVNRVKDERFDPLSSTRAAARLLKYNYSQLKDWALAITAYNHGLGSMRKARRRYGNYLTIREKYLRRSFGFASKNFYPEFLAVVEISDSLEQYFPDIEKDSVLVFQEFKLPKAVKLTHFAKRFGIDPDLFEKLNPGFRTRTWRGYYQVPAGYTLRLPLTTDAGMILAALGAPDDAVKDVTLVQKDPSQEEIVITHIGELYERRSELRQRLAKGHSDVEPIFQVKSLPVIKGEMYALQDTVSFGLDQMTAALASVDDDAILSATSILVKRGVEMYSGEKGLAIAVLPNISANYLLSLPGGNMETYDLAEGDNYPAALAAATLKPGILPASIEFPAGYGNFDLYLLPQEAETGSHIPGMAVTLNKPGVPSETSTDFTNQPIHLPAPGGNLYSPGPAIAGLAMRTDDQADNGVRMPGLKPGVEMQFHIASRGRRRSNLSGRESLASLPVEPGDIYKTETVSFIREPSYALGRVKPGIKSGLPLSGADNISDLALNIMPGSGEKSLPEATSVFTLAEGPSITRELNFAKADVPAPANKLIANDHSYTFNAESGTTPLITGIEHTPVAFAKPRPAEETYLNPDVETSVRSFQYVLHGGFERPLTGEEIHLRMKGNWLAHLKPGVEYLSRELPVTAAASQAEQPVSEERETPVFASASSIYFKKQGVEYETAWPVNFQTFSPVSNAREFSIQEMIAILQQRLNVDNNGDILVYPRETLGHFSEWLMIDIGHLRRINNLSRHQQILTGQRLNLDFSQVTPAAFLNKRIKYHLTLIAPFLQGNETIKLVDHTIRSGENLWNLAHKRYKFPVNLLLYFNDLDKLERLYPGDVIKLPVTHN